MANNPAFWLESVARSDPERPLLQVPDETSYSYGDVACISGQFATYLAKCGIRMGDRVAVQVDKSPHSLILCLACIRLGAIYVPLNTAYSKAELEYFINDCAPQALVCRPNRLDEIKPIAKKFNVPNLLSLGVNAEGTLIDEAAHCSSDKFLAFDGKPSEVAALLYTSGTTGRSKGAMITRGALAHCAKTLSDTWHFTQDDILLHALPIFHGHGLFIAANTVLYAGARMIFMKRFDTDEVVRLLPNASVFMGVPTMYMRLLKHAGFSKTVCNKLRLAISGSAPITLETLEGFKEISGCTILERYGLTETLIVTANPYNGTAIQGSVGLPVHEVEVRLADIKTGKIIGSIDQVGTIEVRGPGLFKGYWKNPKKTAEDMCKDGYFKTGDLGRFDENGYLYIVGRDKDMIITGGYNVYPKEVEIKIDELPFVDESAVIGLPHPDFGEAVTAIIVTNTPEHPNESEIIDELKKSFTKYKCPKRIIFMETLPRNAMGKVQKNQLRQDHKNLYQ